MDKPTAYGDDLIDPDTLFHASAMLLDLRRFGDQILGSLLLRLRGAAGMFGADAVGLELARSYDEAASLLCRTIAQLDLFCGQVATGLRLTTKNYWPVDSPPKPAVPIPLCSSTLGLGREVVATFRDEDVPATLLTDLGAIGDARADAATLRYVAEGWMIASSSVGHWRTNFQRAVDHVTAANSGATIDAFRDTLHGVVGLLAELGARCAALGAAVAACVDNVEATALMRAEAAAATTCAADTEAYLLWVRSVSPAGSSNAPTVVMVIGAISIPVEVEPKPTYLLYENDVVARGSRVPPSYQFPLLSEAEIDELVAWLETLSRSPKDGESRAHDYDWRIAGPESYLVPAGPGRAVVADGYRREDGALISTKYVDDPSRSPYVSASLSALEYDAILAQQDEEIARFAAALRDPATVARFLEVVVNYPASIPYFKALMLKHDCPGLVCCLL